MPATALVIVDLHLHYPMHVRPRARSGRGERLRFETVEIVSRLGNYRSFRSGPGVTVPLMKEGRIGVGLSVLFSFWDEWDVLRRGGTKAPPSSRYFRRLVDQLEDVEAEIDSMHPQAAVAHDPGELSRELDSGRIALVHCVEGSFHLGPDADEIARNVGELAERGVAYVTIGHLINRGVADVANVIPFVPDRLAPELFRQPAAPLLAPARAAMRACVDERILIDLAHLSERSLDAAFELLDHLDPQRGVPVVHSHGGYRFGRRPYMLGARHIEAIAGRDGLVGLIFSRRQVADGVMPPYEIGTFEDSIAVLCRQIDEIESITGSLDHVAIGSDMDGFIQPFLPEIEDCSAHARVERALVERYGAAHAARICSENAMRLLQEYWRS